MKNIKLTAEIKDFYGNPVRANDGTVLRHKDVLLAQLWSFETEDTVKAGRVHSVGSKLGVSSDETIDLEDADIELIKEALNKPRFVAGVTAQVYASLEG